MLGKWYAVNGVWCCLHHLHVDPFLELYIPNCPQQISAWIVHGNQYFGNQYFQNTTMCLLSQFSTSSLSSSPSHLMVSLFTQ